MVYTQSITSQVPYVVRESSPNLYISTSSIKNPYCVTDLPIECQPAPALWKSPYMDLQPLPALRKSPRLDAPIIDKFTSSIDDLDDLLQQLDDQEAHKVTTVNRDLDELLEELMRVRPSDRELDELLEELMKPQTSEVIKAQRDLDQLLEELAVHSEIDTEMNNFMVL